MPVVPTPAPAGLSGASVVAASAGVPYSRIYKLLVTDTSDAVGAIAYILYKRDKIAFIEATLAAHGRAPTAD